MNPNPQPGVWKALSEPTVAVAFVSATAYFVAIQYWNSYLKAIGVEPSLLDPSVGRLLSFSFNGIVGACCFLATNEWLYRIQRTRNFIAALVLWVALAEVVYMYPKPGVAVAATPLLFVWGAVQNRRDAPKRAAAVKKMGEIRSRLMVLHARMRARERQTIELTDRAFVGDPSELSDEQYRRLTPDVSDIELKALGRDISDLEEESRESAYNERIYKWRHAAILVLVALLYTYSVAPAIARFAVALDIAAAQWSSRDGIESPLVTDGTTTISLRQTPCAIAVSTEELRFVRPCPSLVERHIRDGATDEYMVQELLKARRQQQYERLLASMAQDAGAIPLSTGDRAYDGGVPDGGVPDARVPEVPDGGVP